MAKTEEFKEFEKQVTPFDEHTRIISKEIFKRDINLLN